LEDGAVRTAGSRRGLFHDPSESHFSRSGSAPVNGYDGGRARDIDVRVAQGSYTGTVFTNAVLTVYQDTFCTKCGYIWHTLIIPSDNPYLDDRGVFNHELFRTKIVQSKILTCPTCHASLRQLVVKIFGEVEGERLPDCMIGIGHG